MNKKNQTLLQSLHECCKIWFCLLVSNNPFVIVLYKNYHSTFCALCQVFLLNKLFI